MLWQGRGTNAKEILKTIDYGGSLSLFSAVSYLGLFPHALIATTASGVVVLGVSHCSV